MFLNFPSLTHLVLLIRYLLVSDPTRKKDTLRGNMAGFQRERLMGQCCLVLVSRALNAQLLCVRNKSIHQFSIWFPFPLLPYFFIWRVYCFFMELLLITYIFPCLILCPTFVLFCFLQETDWSNVHSKLLISSTDVQRSNVHDGQS